MRQKLLYVITVLLVLLPFTLSAQFTAITNEGQWPDHVLASAKLNGGNIYFAKDAVHFDLLDPEIVNSWNAHRHGGGESFASDKEHPDRLRGHHYQLQFLKANLDAEVRFEDQFSGRVNFFIGKDPEKWGRNARRYGRVVYGEIYEGIDCHFFQNNEGHLKYEFYLEPGKSASAIQLKYENAGQLRIDEEGRLLIETSVTEVKEYIPLVYQPTRKGKDEVNCEYKLDGNVISFYFPDGYDTSRPLVIDPVLAFSSYSGSVSDNFGFTATYDTSDHLYGGGMAFGNKYPITDGAYDTLFAGYTDIAITKFSKEGDTLIYSTYIGGRFTEMPHSLFVSTDSILHIYGITGSDDFPTTVNAFDSTFNGGNNELFFSNGADFPLGTDIYVAQLSPDGSDLLNSTYLGGSKNDGLNRSVRKASSYPDTGVTLNYGDIFRGEIVVDQQGYSYIASCTRSNDFPITQNPFQENLKGAQDGLLIKFNPDLSQLAFSTFFGGDDIDASFSVKLNSDGDVITSGGTCSRNFPVTNETYQATFGGGVSDGFLSRFSTDGELLASTYIGGQGLDISYFIDFDYENSIYITGSTDSDDYPKVGNTAAFSESGQFITKFDDSLKNVLMSTRFGSGLGKPELSPTAFLVDDCKNIYVSGWGGKINDYSLSKHPRKFLTNMPLTPDAFQKTTDGSDFYFIVFSEDADSLIYGTYFGGNIAEEHVDGGTSRFDKDGIIYQAVCGGCGGSSDFPTTPNAWSRTNNSDSCNLAVLKFEFRLLEVKSHAIAGPDTFDCAPLEVQFENLGTDNAYYYWDFDNGDFIEKENPLYIFEEAGSYDVSLIVKPRKPCLIGDTTQVHVEVLERTEADFDYSPKIIELNQIVNFENLSVGGENFRWYLEGSPMATTENWETTLTESGLYEVCLEIENDQCTDSICKNVIIPIVDVPNAFSPNADGNNDVLYVLGFGVTELDFRLYDRWGQLMFQTNDLSKGWDGIYKGKPQEMDVYVYVLNATLENGKTVSKKGNITLIR